MNSSGEMLAPIATRPTEARCIARVAIFIAAVKGSSLSLPLISTSGEGGDRPGGLRLRLALRPVDGDLRTRRRRGLALGWECNIPWVLSPEIAPVSVTIIISLTFSPQSFLSTACTVLKNNIEYL